MALLQSLRPSVCSVPLERLRFGIQIAHLSNNPRRSFKVKIKKIEVTRPYIPQQEMRYNRWSRVTDVPTKCCD